jgi:nucleotide-binding universal stress UspA family protein
MAQSKQPIVVVGVDYSETGDLAFDRAIQLCQAEPNSALHVVNVAPLHLAADLGFVPMLDPRTRPVEVEARLRDYLQKKVSDLEAQNRSLPAPIEAHVRWDSPGEEIAQLAADLEADLVVVGTHGRRGLGPMPIG